MTYNSIVAIAGQIRAGNEDILSADKYTDTDLVALNKTAALAEMKFDIQAAIPIDYDDTTTIDDVADKYPLRLGKALSYKQLALFYQKNDTGAGTKNRARWEMYQRLYEKERQGFGGLKLNAPTNNVTSIPFKR